ncbi:MAG: hypothetical protein EGQ84_01515 [Slackia sp.]|nr:hypothetical protein [Slackia sp.]MBS6499835.1 hypothetical protein [Slackia sp.]
MHRRLLCFLFCVVIICSFAA